MKKIISFLLNCFREQPTEFSIEEAVQRSVKKYRKTYKLLEKYGKLGPKTPFLADDENIKEYFRYV